MDFKGSKPVLHSEKNNKNKQSINKLLLKLNEMYSYNILRLVTDKLESLVGLFPFQFDCRITKKKKKKD